jgi:phosphoenolpyruvate-protein kinase (PTS system EI component)
MDKIRMNIDTIQSQENNLLSSEALRLQVDSRTIIDTILTAILIAPKHPCVVMIATTATRIPGIYLHFWE